MIDTLNANLHNLKKPKFFKDLCLKNKNYFVLTLHRPSNVDDINQLQMLIEKIASGVRELPIIFPAHPRTTKILSEQINLPSNIYLVEPQPYLEFNFIVKNAKAVITDSGGITEETTVMGVPCMTLRENTERPETISIGTNELIGNDPDKMNKALDKLFKGNWKKGDIPYLWDGMSGKRIVDHLEKILCT
jgi:UDP-N-acetylglucosamine 2-epimerase (non-hydrolysing)